MRCKKCNSINLFAVRDAGDIPYLICDECKQAMIDTRLFNGRQQALWEELRPKRDYYREKTGVDIFNEIWKCESDWELERIRHMATSIEISAVWDMFIKGGNVL